MTYTIPSYIDPSIFRAYDVRGIVDKNLHANDVYAITRAFASAACELGEQDIVMAYDGRVSSDVLRHAVRQGLLDSGCRVVDIGLVPTPVLYYATHTVAKTGIMLTGSHNPKEYNGLKMVLKRESLSESLLQSLYQRIVTQRLCQGRGSYQRHDLRADYINAVGQGITLSRPLHVVVDAGSGVAGVIAPDLLRALGCRVTPLFCAVNGDFPHHHPDPSQAKNLVDLQQAVLAEHADLGFAFDGDGDRLGVVTSRGEIIWPDRQMMLYAIDVLRTHPGATIVFDVKCSRQLGQVITQHGGTPVMWKTGHSLIKHKLKQSGALLAGEMSGHIFFNDAWFGFDDALYTAARLLQIVARGTQTSHDLFAQLPTSVSTAELQLPMPEEKKFAFVQQFCEKSHFAHARVITIDGMRVEFADAWGLLRASNTTPNLVLRFEADTDAGLQRIQHLFRQQMRAIEPDLEWSF